MRIMNAYCIINSCSKSQNKIKFSRSNLYLSEMLLYKTEVLMYIIPPPFKKVIAGNCLLKLLQVCYCDYFYVTYCICCYLQAFSEATASTFGYSFKDTAPFIVKNALGVSLKVLPSSSLRIVGEKENMNEIETGQSMELEYSVFETFQRGRLSALYRQESSVFSLNLGIVLRSTVCYDKLVMGMGK